MTIYSSTQGDAPGIVLLDDEQHFLNASKAQLRTQYKVFITKEPNEVVGFLQSHEISIIVSDQRMPGITGCEFFKSIHPRFPDVIKIIITAYADWEQIKKGIHEGYIYSYVIKPVNVEEFQLLLDRAYKYYLACKEKRQLLLELESKEQLLQKYRNQA